MADVLPPTQKLDGTATVAGPPLVDLSRLPKQAPATADKQTPTTDSGSVLTKLQLSDDSQPAAAPVKAAEKVAPTAVAQTGDVAPAPAAPVKVADHQATAVAAADFDKNTAYSFTPTTDHEKSKAWWDARGQIVGRSPEKDPNCLYKVQFGDDLSTIAQRQLQAEGKAVNSAALKAEEDKLVKLNDAQYKSLDCNRHYLQAGWRLKLTDDCAATPAPGRVEAAPLPAPAAVEAHPQLPLDNRDRSYNGAVVDGGFHREDHVWQTPGHHIIFNFNHQQYPFDVPPGKSIIYDDNGRQRMITECNQDGSRPRHSEIIYRIDHEGRRHSVSPDEQQSYYQRFAPDYSQNYDNYRDNGGLPVQDRFSIEERRVNEERRIRDEQLRRQQAEQLEAQRLEAQPLEAQPLEAQPRQQLPEQHPMTAKEIEELKTPAERTAARTAAMGQIREQQQQEQKAKIWRLKQQHKKQEQEEQQNCQAAGLFACRDTVTPAPTPADKKTPAKPAVKEAEATPPSGIATP